MKDEHGISLIELLASLVIVSIIIVIIMTTFTIGVRYNLIETVKATIQQESNLILTTLISTHRTTECYQLSNPDKEIHLVIYDDVLCEGNIISNINFSHNNLDYQFAISGLIADAENRYTINSRRDQYTFELTLNSVDPNFENSYKTNIYRITN